MSAKKKTEKVVEASSDVIPNPLVLTKRQFAELSEEDKQAFVALNGTVCEDQE